MSNFIFGRYLPGNSFIHRMDPRAKLILSFYFAFIVFLAKNVWGYLLLLLLTLFCIYLSNIRLKVFLNGLKPLFFLIIVTILMQLFFTNEGHIYWKFWIFTFTSSGIYESIVITVRFILIVFMSTLMTLTTTPMDIASAVSYLLKPLAIFNFPIDEAGLMLSIALRMVPTLADETVQIMQAQRSRGISYANGSFVKRIKSIISLLIPIFVDSFNRATNLAIAMEARGYQSNHPRTHYHQLKWKKSDTYSLLLMFFLLPILVLLRFVNV